MGITIRFWRNAPRREPSLGRSNMPTTFKPRCGSSPPASASLRRPPHSARSGGPAWSSARCLPACRRCKRCWPGGAAIRLRCWSISVRVSSPSLEKPRRDLQKPRMNANERELTGPNDPITLRHGFGTNSSIEPWTQGRGRLRPLIPARRTEAPKWYLYLSVLNGYA